MYVLYAVLQSLWTMCLYVRNVRMYCSHYFVHGGWFEEDGQLLNRVSSIRHIPATIVQGRYDVVTPMKTAWELHKVIDYYVDCLIPHKLTA